MTNPDRHRLARDVIDLAWPAVLQGLVTTVVFFTDRLLLGRYGTDALGSMAISGPLLWSVFSIVGAYSAGIVTVVGRAVGAGDRRRAGRTLRSVLWFALGAGSVVAIAGIVWRAPVAELLAGGQQTSPQTRLLAVDYLEIVFPVAPLAFVGMAASTALQAGGDTRTPMRIGMLTGVVNLALTWLLIYGHFGLPELGVRGAAIGTTAALVLQCGLVLAVLRRTRGPVTLRPTADGETPADRVSARTPLRSVLRISGPAFGEKLLYHSGYLVFTALIGHLGDVAMAAHQALIAVESISFIAAEGVGVAAGALVAQRLGAGRPEEAAQTGWLSAWIGALALGAVGLGFLIAAPWLVRLFNDDPEVVALGATCLRVAAVAQPLMAITDALAGGLRGAGDTRTPMLVALVGPVLVRLSSCWLLAYPLGLGLVGIWIGSSLDWLVRTLWLTRAFRAGRWRHLSPDA